LRRKIFKFSPNEVKRHFQAFQMRPNKRAGGGKVAALLPGALTSRPAGNRCLLPACWRSSSATLWLAEGRANR